MCASIIHNTYTCSLAKYRKWERHWFSLTKAEVTCATSDPHTDQSGHSIPWKLGLFLGELKTSHRGIFCFSHSAIVFSPPVTATPVPPHLLRVLQLTGFFQSTVKCACSLCSNLNQYKVSRVTMWDFLKRQIPVLIFFLTHYQYGEWPIFSININILMAFIWQNRQRQTKKTWRERERGWHAAMDPQAGVNPGSLQQGLNLLYTGCTLYQLSDQGAPV